MNILYYVVHPDLDHSNANRSLLRKLPLHPQLKVIDLYDRYPSFSVNAVAEKELIDWADALFFQHPLYWYSVPALLKQWFEIVLTPGYAYGKEGTALAGKRWQHIISTGGNANAYRSEGYNQYSMEELLRPLESTAGLCRCEWHEPLIHFSAKHARGEQLNAFNDQVVNTLTDLLETR
ncbi:NAD(P)H-dependent oxidoreductase [Reinekea marinisedimentorum]|uniref:Glutathione-regulated potassium-efflux system ancillary protein KefG n=1 Tax=Reinekea marinisedimentorum TaxID=230495 RepID=A0A4R3IDW5_9GAMM|nr:NAD(P)H-dependent oxidoreductase [Reinekea marinisedimentorum]TCS44064.1 glutathione-regulated potassium-efflux system ancillary protein KefG [Reinekea marinisedimentorum]